MASTIVEAFGKQVAALSERVALRRCGARGWEDITWRQYGQAVEDVAWALLAAGISRGERVGILSTNSPEWLFADLAVLSIGAVSVPIYPTLIARHVLHPLAHAEVRLIFVGDAAQRDKVREIRSEARCLQHVVCIGAEAGAEEISWCDFVAMGRPYRAQHPDALHRARAEVAADTMASIVYTSGTTGAPKGAMISHGNMIHQALQIEKHVAMQQFDQTLSFLPLCHLAERVQGEVAAIQLGLTVSFARSLETVRDDLVDVRPTVLVCVPRMWEKIHAGIVAKVASAPARRRALFRWALRAGRARFLATCEGKPLGWGMRLQAELADRLVGKKIRARLGLDRVRFVVSGAAPLSVGVLEFFGALRLPIQEAYGQTECAGVCFGAAAPEQIRPGCVGTALPGIDARIAEDGEVLIRGPNVFMGYYKDPSTTAEVLKHGWLHTGDVGEIDADGYLRITDRKKDIIVTSGGKNVAPQNIENRLKVYPGISQVVVLGDKRKYLVALITVDRETMAQAVGETAQGIQPSTSPAVRAHLDNIINEVNQTLSSYETVKHFEVLDTDFSIEGGELTPTMKVKRRVVDERYRSLIDGLYNAA